MLVSTTAFKELGVLIITLVDERPLTSQKDPVTSLALASTLPPSLHPSLRPLLLSPKCSAVLVQVAFPPLPKSLFTQFLKLCSPCGFSKSRMIYFLPQLVWIWSARIYFFNFICNTYLRFVFLSPRATVAAWNRTHCSFMIRFVLSICRRFVPFMSMFYCNLLKYRGQVYLVFFYNSLLDKESNKSVFTMSLWNTSALRSCPLILQPSNNGRLSSIHMWNVVFWGELMSSVWINLILLLHIFGM